MNILQHLREADRALYSACLYLPEEKRQAIAAVFAFQLEIERMRDLVSEPVPGEIRLQWWRDAMAGERPGEVAGHPLAVALREAAEGYGLPVAAFDRMCEARIFDLYDDPMPGTTELEAWCGETWGLTFQLAAQVLGDGRAPESGDAAGHTGIAFAVSRICRDLTRQRRRGQLFVPPELFAAAGTSGADFLAKDDREAAGRVVRAVTGFGLDHAEKASAFVRAAGKKEALAFAPLALARVYLKKARKLGARTAFEQVSLSPIGEQLALLTFSARL